MKIKVQREDGKVETIPLGDSLMLSDGHSLNCLRLSCGFQHFFTKEGYYDGWGGSVEHLDPTQPKVVLGNKDETS